MKNIITIAAIASTAVFSQLNAQTVTSDIAVNSVRSSDNTSVSSGTNESISAKALRNFAKAYRTASAPEWSELNDKGFMCRFTVSGISTRAYYNNKGSWLYTIASYQEAQLPKDIRNTVKSVYFDYQISFVNEIQAIDNKSIYLVQVQDEKKLKVLRVTSEEMEVLQELDKK